MSASDQEPVMSSTTEPLIVDMVEWIAREPRTYDEVMEAWRTSCPRLTVWEDAVDRGLVRRELRSATGLMVVVTSEGRELLQAHGRSSAQTRVEPASAFALRN
jgi:hypothetical protein